jgi:hypothetical protein
MTELSAILHYGENIEVKLDEIINAFMSNPCEVPNCKCMEMAQRVTNHPPKGASKEVFKGEELWPVIAEHFSKASNERKRQKAEGDYEPVR